MLRSPVRCLELCGRGLLTSWMRDPPGKARLVLVLVLVLRLVDQCGGWNAVWLRRQANPNPFTQDQAATGTLCCRRRSRLLDVTYDRGPDSLC